MSALASPACVSGCFGNERTSFPEGLEPLEENVAELPAPTDEDPTPEAISVASGSNDDHIWVHARAYVDAPLERSWEALRNPDAVADRRKVAEYSVVWDVEPEYPFSFRIHNVVDDIITVEFDVTWRQGLAAGTVEDPGAVAIRYAKTWGTTFITRLEGSIVATPVDDETTLLDMIELLDAAGGGAEAVASYLTDLHASVVAVAHDRPLPEY
ncbi:MAG: hypothetical protein HYY06_19895 [Deltaproteobacteria bacterium]|nr:hypothetical protein [Deltaproteobacteria bacterium]